MSPLPSPDSSATDYDDASLIVALRRRDEAAFEHLVRHYGPRLYAVIRQYLGSEETCRDVLQETYLSAYRGLDGFAGESTLATWLHRIAVNAALMKLRTQKRHPETAIEDLLPKFAWHGHRVNPGPAWSTTSEAEVESEERRRLVRENIDKLPTAYRTVILLRDIDDRSTAETAAILELSEAVVKTRLHRARQALRELLDSHFGKASC